MRKFFGLIRFWFAGVFFLFSILFHTQESFAQSTETLLGWNFYDINSPASAPASIVHKKITSSSLLTRGPGAPPTSRLNSFLTNGFGNDGISTTNTDYFQFTVGVDPADTLSLKTIDTKYLSSIDTAFIHPNGVYSQFAYSLNGTDFILIDTPLLSYHNTSNLAGSIPSINLGAIPSLQNILNGTTVTFRYYVSGHTANGVFGFISDFSTYPALSIKGIIKTKRHIITAATTYPIDTTFYLADCNSSVSGTVNFTSVETFPPGNVYVARVNTSQWAGDTASMIIGTLASSANSGTINFTIPGTIPQLSPYNPYKIWIESSLVPDALSVSTRDFRITKGIQCHTPNSWFRSKQSGNWNDISIWEMYQEGISGGAWVPSTFIPNRSAYRITISAPDTVELTTPVGVHSIDVAGKIKVANNANDRGSITFYSNIIVRTYDFFRTMEIKSGGVLQIVSSAPYDSVIRMSPQVANDGAPQMIRMFGKVVIGDGSSVNGPGFYQFGTSPMPKKFWWAGVLEWNTTSTNGFIPTRYFFHNDYDAAKIRIINIGPGAFGGPGTTIINGALEVNADIDVTGTVIIVPNN